MKSLLPKHLTTLTALLFALTISAQSVRQRTTQYYPDGNAFTCINGNNRFTRALYGSIAEWRLETSDRPVFATFKKNDYRNIRFVVSYKGKSIQLDSTDYCEARYVNARRDYLLRDKRWGNGTLQLSVLAYPDAEGAIWKFTATGFDDNLWIEQLMCETRESKFSRSGDIGSFEKPYAFEAPLQPKKLKYVKQRISHDLYFMFDGEHLSADASATSARRYNETKEHYDRLASSVSFTTPDPYINPVGCALVAAADGAWSGQVWLHGAVGWRMPLPGWRAAYMGDFLGMPDRQRIHFDAYAKSQVTDVPVSQPHVMDEENNLARGAYIWGTPMYSDGYICRNPERNNQFHHYDMNLVYIDELLWHFQFDADTAYMRKMWPIIKRHLAWEKKTWDPDGDGLYDAYCCIWASDALQYNSGAVTHSSAYNYRGNLLAARIAELIGEDGSQYKKEADAILKAMNERLWISSGAGANHWAEYQDFMGLKRVHENAALWSIYTPIDCEAGTPEQYYQATRYVDSAIPHIPFAADGKEYYTLSTSNWSPYEWSINNVAMAEVMHTILAYYQAGRKEEAYRLLKANIMDFMYLGRSPGNLGQLSAMDEALGEGYRDFADVTGISSRAIIEGLFGITPNALYGECIIRPGFPESWDSASIHTPYLTYSFKRVGNKDVYDIVQHFKQPLRITIRQNIGNGEYKDTAFSTDTTQHIEIAHIDYKEEAPARPTPFAVPMGTAFNDIKTKACRTVNMDGLFNSNVTDIFKNKYLTPRSPYTTLCVPTQGIGDWCSTKRTANIDDTKLRSMVKNGLLALPVGNNTLPFRSTSEGNNIAYVSLWDNYPDSISISLRGKAAHAYLLMAGSTNPMQFDIANGVVIATYTDGTEEQMELHSPSNWCPIEQDYLEDAPAFTIPEPRPYRVGLSTGIVSRSLFHDSAAKPKKAVCNIDGGAAILLDMPLNPKKKLRSLKIKALSNEVVIGLMGITLQ